jgi:glucosylceramidase
LLFTAKDKAKAKAKVFGKDRRVTAYTSASSTDLRLTKHTNLRFTDLKQPLETQICVFVNPRKTFQTYLGLAALSRMQVLRFCKINQRKSTRIPQCLL